MKIKLLLIILLLTLITKGQKGSYSYNIGTTTVQKNDSGRESSASLKQQNSLIIMPRIMNQKEIILVLEEKNNSEINKLVKKFKLAKGFKNIGFAAIPAGIIGTVSVMDANILNRNTAAAQMGEQNFGIACFAFGAVCLSANVYLGVEQRKNYKKAIRKYNELYN